MSFSKFTFLLLSILILNSHSLSAVTVKDTLFTSDGDRIILTYNLSRSDNQYTVTFSNQLKKLGRINSSKYKDLSKVAVMFFDRTGGFSNNVSITNMVPEAFMIPSNVNYERSADGFFIVQDNPSISFAVNGNSEISLPIYLAYHTKKGKYTLFSKCKSMKIRLSSSSHTPRQNSSSHVTQQTITSTEELEVENTASLKILESINLARTLLAEADKLPFSESLQDEIGFIRMQKRQITDTDLLSLITEVLNLYDDKKSALEQKATEEEKEAQRAAENAAKREADALQAKNDSTIAAQQEQAEKDKKKNMWMMIGGIVLAILAFIGNQLFQNYRNSKNQKNMMNIQQNIAAEAEAEAKRRARNAARNATNHATDQVKGAVRKKTTITVNGKTKDLSI